MGSSGAGWACVLVLQNLQARVQVSPISMIVAVAIPSLPPQHSPMFGHLASSHTVASLSSRTYTLTIYKYINSFEQVLVILSRRKLRLQPWRQASANLFFGRIGRRQSRRIDFVVVDKICKIRSRLQLVLE